MIGQYCSQVVFCFESHFGGKIQTKILQNHKPMLKFCIFICKMERILIYFSVILGYLKGGKWLEIDFVYDLYSNLGCFYFVLWHFDHIEMHRTWMCNLKINTRQDTIKKHNTENVLESPTLLLPSNHPSILISSLYPKFCDIPILSMCHSSPYPLAFLGEFGRSVSLKLKKQNKTGNTI